jgi:hypothetical protein
MLTRRTAMTMIAVLVRTGGELGVTMLSPYRH